jgi:hypothetical protein
MRAERRTWKEKRVGGKSETTYRGLYIELDWQVLLVSKLSHGLRVIEVQNMDDYYFERESSEVELSTTFWEAIVKAFRVDQEFQKQLPEYKRLLS